MLSNAYFLATFRFDTAKYEPAKKLQKTFAMVRGVGLGPRSRTNGDRRAGPHHRGVPEPRQHSNPALPRPADRT